MPLQASQTKRNSTSVVAACDMSLTRHLRCQQFTLVTEIQVIRAAISPPTAPHTAPAAEQFFQVMEKAMGMTADPITTPMNCRGQTAAAAAANTFS